MSAILVLGVFSALTLPPGILTCPYITIVESLSVAELYSWHWIVSTRHCANFGVED